MLELPEIERLYQGFSLCFFRMKINDVLVTRRLICTGVPGQTRLENAC